MAERSGIRYSDHAKCQQDNLIICDPRVRRKSKEAICRICKRSTAKCQTTIYWDEERRQSEISLSIQRAHTDLVSCSTIQFTYENVVATCDSLIS